MNIEKQPTGWTILGIALAELLVLSTALGGCSGDEPGDSPLYVDIACDAPTGRPRCFYEAQEANYVAVTIDGVLSFEDTDIHEWRVVYIDSPPEGAVVELEACDDLGCISTVAEL